MQKPWRFWTFMCTHTVLGLRSRGEKQATSSYFTAFIRLHRISNSLSWFTPLVFRRQYKIYSLLQSTKSVHQRPIYRRVLSQIFRQTRVTMCKCGEVRKGSNWAWNGREREGLFFVEAPYFFQENLFVHSSPCFWPRKRKPLDWLALGVFRRQGLRIEINTAHKKECCCDSFNSWSFEHPPDIGCTRQRQSSPTPLWGTL